jgi:hypothetical protein
MDDPPREVNRRKFGPTDLTGNGSVNQESKFDARRAVKKCGGSTLD